MYTDVHVDTDTQDNSSVFWTPALSLAATCLDLYGTTLTEHVSDFQRVIIHEHFWYFIPFEHAFPPHLSHTVTVSLLLIETLRNFFKDTAGCTLKSLRISNSAVAKVPYSEAPLPPLLASTLGDITKSRNADSTLFSWNTCSIQQLVAV